MARVNLSSMPNPPKEYVVDFPRLDGGLNTWDLSYRLDANESPEMKNLWWKNGALCSRDGQVYVSEDAIGEAFTVYSGHGMTWGEVADAYAAETGVRIEWVSDDAYLDAHPKIRNVGCNAYFMWYYDRRVERDIDCSKILSVTGLTRADFASVAEGIRTELGRLGWERK